ncbi:hypothetical protein [Xanthomonas vesicatoria]|uniref:Uncharacterized protein n=2 Tax=Xanthomonas vesicatoria TaxID=56460 RepID=F4YU01_9XANT|nr:hypothetical protein [Xanthomonas vesicatoria]AEC46813.1 hypothetical protein [Xanthomonas vesicatoria]MCC8559248.1 hypothetical protein [Xanthomonas vesicatoria]MCC8597986.1 hypothetical protein [Xanthomonas vesicatoria]MCC8602200.1 hypothetical protein [Xanthomonas vesicatoria]MCC8604854.1 hypothetical protein [Xanthomonas vesicatoria]
MVSDRWNPRLWIRDWLSRPSASEHARRSQLERAVVRTAATNIARMKRASIDVPSVAVDALTGQVAGVELRTYSLGEPAKRPLPPEAAPPAFDVVRRRWEQGARAPASSAIPEMLRNGVAIALTVAGLAAFCSGLLGNKEDSDDIADAGAHVVAPQGSEPQEWGGGVHDAHGASAGQAATTMNCTAFQGGAQ